MSLQASEIESVQASWEKCEPIADAAADIFYARLFELDPALRSLFPTEMREQKKKLMTMIGAAVRMLGRLDTLVPVVEAMGRRHTAYGVVEAHYPTVGSALLFTLEKGLGELWTADLAVAWTKVYGLLSTTMINAAREPHGS